MTTISDDSPLREAAAGPYELAPKHVRMLFFNYSRGVEVLLNDLNRQFCLHLPAFMCNLSTSYATER